MLSKEQIERIYDRYGGDMMNCTRAIERAVEAEFRKEIEAAVPGTHVTRYTIEGCDPHNQIHITQALQISGLALWAVRRHSTCLNKDGEWECEPMPSSRDDDFLERCRFSTPAEAVNAYHASTQPAPTGAQKEGS